MIGYTPTGPHTVGTTDFAWPGQDGDALPVAGRLWYPTDGTYASSSVSNRLPTVWIPHTNYSKGAPVRPDRSIDGSGRLGLQRVQTLVPAGVLEGRAGIRHGMAILSAQGVHWLVARGR